MKGSAMVSALPYALNKAAEDELCRIYITDALKVIAENTALEGGKMMAKRYYDILNPGEEDNRTAEEIVEDVLSAAGIEVI
jgi:hypothetical protein